MPVERLSSMSVKIPSTSFLAMMDCFVYRMGVLDGMDVFWYLNDHMVAAMTEKVLKHTISHIYYHS